MNSQTRYRDVEIRAARGSRPSAKSWLSEAALRMLMNNLDPEVADNPKELVVYGGLGRAARDWECYDRLVECLTNLEADETLLVQSGKPVGIFKTHENAPGCSWPIPTWRPAGPPGSTLTIWTPGG